MVGSKSGEMGKIMTEAEFLVSTDPAEMLRHLREEFLRAAGVYGRWVLRDRPLITDRQLRLWVEACRKIEERIRGENVYAIPIQLDLSNQDKLLEAVKYWSTGSDDQWSPSHAVRAALIREIVGNPFRQVYTLGDDKPKPGDILFDHEWLTPTVIALARGIAGGQECERCGGFGRNREAERHMAMRVKCTPCHGTGNTSFDPSGMPMLADALEEAGADCEDLLRHLRGYEKCTNGCCVNGIEVKDGERICPICLGDNCGIPLRHGHVAGCWAIQLLLGEIE